MREQHVDDEINNSKMNNIMKIIVSNNNDSVGKRWFTVTYDDILFVRQR